MKYELTPSDVEKIQIAINSNGVSEAIVKVENGKVVVFLSKRKKIV